MNQELINLCKNFKIPGDFHSIDIVPNGHINSTFIVKFFNNDNINEYILQKINKNVFKQPIDVMNNAIAITEHINKKQKNANIGVKTLNFHQSIDGNYFVVDEVGDFWRISDFIKNSITFNETQDLKIIEETGVAFGQFQQYLADFPAHILNPIIPNFHNTQNRYDAFKSVVQNDPYNRSAQTTQEILDYLSFEDIATTMHKMLLNKNLPLRVTHNDTKCNNVLFDKNTKKYICVIDLDTVMPGLLGFDFGDAIRFIANTAKEDEINLDSVTIDLNKFKAFAKGFLESVGENITENEKNTLALSSLTMTIECGLRFLTDYLDGDNYFKINYPEHNLDRARCQLKLAKEMYKNLDIMQSIVDKYYSQTNQPNK